MRLVPGAHPLAAIAVRPRGVDAAASVRGTAPLWARGVTPTRGVHRSVYQPDSLLPRDERVRVLHRFRSLSRGARGGAQGGGMTEYRWPPRTVRAITMVAVLLVWSACPASEARAATIAPLAIAPARVVAWAAPDRDARWRWPVTPPRVTEQYRAPAHAYGAGHRGIDLLAPVGTNVSAVADGVVAFAGVVVDRGVVTIDHGDGVVSTLEPIDPHVAVGDVVRAGEPVGVLAGGGHTRIGEVHLGARLAGEYVNPLLLLSAMPRAVLLPCCE